MYKRNYDHIVPHIYVVKILSNNNGIVRDEEWLNWRLMECPFKNNIRFCYVYKEGINKKGHSWESHVFPYIC